MATIVDLIKNMPDYVGAHGSTETEISHAEQVLGIQFAPDYRAYLSHIGLAMFDGHEFTGLTNIDRLDVISVTIDQRELCGAETASLYVIEEAHIDGIIIWQGSDGTVYLSAPNAKLQIIAHSLSEYIKLSAGGDAGDGAGERGDEAEAL